MARLFISYSRKDEEFVRQLTDDLHRLGADIWLDLRDIHAADDWGDAIHDGLEKSDLMLLIISPDSMQSRNVALEWKYFFNHQKTIVPVVWIPAKIHFQLEPLQRIDFHGQDYEKALHKLHSELGSKGIALNPISVSQPNPLIPVQPSVAPILRTSFSLPMLEWINIPAGKVTLEENAGTFEVAPFAIAKYPVTNLQFQAFIDASDGYKNADWWIFSPFAQEWHKINPEPKASGFKGDKLPRETVSWYDAMAFCGWLAHKTGLAVTLPTEMQWQWAAQGPEGLTYPFGTNFDSKKCNAKESGITKTTPVDQYPDGKSPYGVFDMAGNVWEWCLTESRNPKSNDITNNNQRSLRGGSWISSSTDGPRAGYRYRLDPSHEFLDYGFRCARS